jgi:hypothetical protein
MSNTEHRTLRDWAGELRPNIGWFLLAFIGSMGVVEIVSCVPSPSIRTIIIVMGLCVNALLIAWLSWLRDRDNKTTTRELTILLQRIEKLQKASVDIRRQRQQQEPPRQRRSGLEKSQSDVAEPTFRTDFAPPRTWAEAPRRTEIEGLATSRRWGMGEQDAHKQWARLNAAEKAIVRFVLQKGSAKAAHLMQFRDPGGSRSTDTCAGVIEKSSFLLGDLETGLTINPQLKPYLEKIMV